ncbi:MAG: hypothetical protein WAL90_13510 [Desulfobacterales bacterium]
MKIEKDRRQQRRLLTLAREIRIIAAASTAPLANEDLWVTYRRQC